ncbi:PLDc N-terminal domain-containing protein [Sinomonas sp. G460-2]|uniref:PLDc N-terminal domain-containing protein n=1 Tax=Sinomonas sp. G460-2 TaxID=3393464 RepID=UPI0039EF6982
MGYEFVTTWLGPSQASELQPNYVVLAIAGIPTLAVLAVEIVALVLALTDRRLAGVARFLWLALIVLIPLIGAIAYLTERGRRRVPRPRAEPASN